MGLWHTCSATDSSGDQIAKFFLSREFPLGGAPPLPRWLEVATQELCTKDPPHTQRHISEINSLMQQQLGSFSVHGPLKAAWNASATGLESVTSKFSPDMIKYAGDLAGLETHHLLHFLHTGFPAVGILDAAGMFPEDPEAAPPSLTPRQLFSRAKPLWASAEGVTSGFSPEQSQLIWDSCVEEAKQGLLEGPLPLSDIAFDHNLPVVRFTIFQKDKWRMIDNLKASGTNAAAATRHPIRLPTHAHLAEITHRCTQTRGPSDFQLWKSDHKSAYKQMPLCREHSSACVIIAKEPGVGGRVFGFRPKTLLFGSSLAVISYNYVSNFVAAAFSIIYKTPVVAFYDDFAGPAVTKALGELTLRSFTFFNRVMGFVVNERKCVVGPAVTFLGLNVGLPFQMFDDNQPDVVGTLDGFCREAFAAKLSRAGVCESTPVFLWMPEEKRAALREQILVTLSGDEISHVAADQIFGRLIWAESGLFGRGHRSYMVPILLAKYSSSTKISPSLRSSLTWFAEFLESPRNLIRQYRPCDPRSHVVAFSDASLSRIGAVLRDQNNCWVVSSKVPDEFAATVPKGVNLIFLLEMLAAVFAISLVPEFQNGSRNRANLILLVDNVASQVALTRGGTSDPLCSRTARRFWKQADLIGVFPWLERVPSAANLADPPSRAVGPFGERAFDFTQDLE